MYGDWWSIPGENPKVGDVSDDMDARHDEWFRTKASSYLLWLFNPNSWLVLSQDKQAGAGKAVITQTSLADIFMTACTCIVCVHV